MKRTPKHLLAWILLVATAAALPVLAQRGKDRRQFAEAVEVVTVEVPVEVVMDGEPVRGLTAENFEIYDGRKRQTISGFDVVDLVEEGGRTLPIGEVPISARRHFLLLFDLGFSDPSVIARARKSALDLVEKQFHPSDLVAVATYNPQTGPQLVLGFTPDRDQVKLAIDTLGLNKLVERSADPLALVLVDEDLHQSGTAPGQAGNAGAAAGVADALFLEAAGDYAVGFDRAARGEAQGRVLALTKDFENLARALDDVDGRKHVVYLSEGFDASVILGTDDQGRAEDMAAASATGEFWRVDSEERFGSTGAITALETMLEELRRADCTIQAVDIGGLRAGNDARARAGGQDSLFMMANETGGELYRNFNDLGGAMRSMLDRTSVTYVLAFQPDNLKFDGDYHKLRVELKGVPRGAKVVHRPGFYAPRPYAERSALERTFEAANKILDAEESGTLTTSVVAAPFRAEAGRAYVPVLIEIDGPTFLAGLKDDAAGLEIYAYAIADDGSVGGYLTQTMGIDVSKVRPALEASGLKFFGDLDLPPGDYTLRVLVRDAKDGRSSTRVLPLSVPEFGSGAPTLAMPLFPEEPGKWLMVQETAGSDARSDRPYPFLMGESAYIPAAKPVVAPDSSTRFVLLGYNLGGDSVPLETRFLAADGSVVEGPSVSFVSRDAGASPDATQLVLVLEANGLAPGEYRLVAGLTGEERTTSIPFVVRGS